MNNNKKRDIFYGVVAVATLIVAIIGATLAYFSISVSSNENAVSAKAATVSIEYSDGQEVIAQADELIPSTIDFVKKAYTENAKENIETPEAADANICVDKEGQQICSIYRFSISSTNSERSVTAFLNTNHNEFTNLAYIVYDVNNEDWLDAGTNVTGDNRYTPLTTCNNTNTDENDELITSDDCYTLNDNNIKAYNTIAKNSIFGYTEETANTKTINATTQTYDIVIFIYENGYPQNEDQGKEYRGTIVVDVTGDGYVTGNMDDKKNN